jgi:hypothetical protein
MFSHQTGDLVLVESCRDKHWGLHPIWEGHYQVILSTPTAVTLTYLGSWAHLPEDKTCFPGPDSEEIKFPTCWSCEPSYSSEGSPPHPPHVVKSRKGTALFCAFSSAGQSHSLTSTMCTLLAALLTARLQEPEVFPLGCPPPNLAPKHPLLHQV